MRLRNFTKPLERFARLFTCTQQDRLVLRVMDELHRLSESNHDIEWRRRMLRKMEDYSQAIRQVNLGDNRCWRWLPAKGGE